MKAALRTGTLASLAVIVAAACMGGALALGHSPSSATEPSEPTISAEPTASAVPWRVTEHAGLGEELDPDDPAVLAREIYPGVTLDELDYSDAEVEWALHQNSLAVAGTAIEEQFVKEYAFAHFGPADRTFTIAFAGTAPPAALALLDATGLPYTTIEGLGFTHPEYLAAADAITDQVEAKLISGAGFMIGPDPTITPGAIQVTITGDEATRKRMLAVLGTIDVDAPFSVTVVEGGGIPVMG